MRRALAGLLLVACPPVPDDTGPAICRGIDPVVTLVEGEAPFAPLTEASEVVMVHGPQGGWHIEGSIATDGVCPRTKVHYTVRTIDGVSISDNRLNVALAMTDGTCQGRFVQMFGFLDVRALEDGDRDTPPELLSGARVVMAMELEDTCGNMATTEVEVTAIPDPADQ